MAIVLPPKKYPGDVIRSADHNLIVDALDTLDKRLQLTSILAIPTGRITMSSGTKGVYVPFNPSVQGSDPSVAVGWPLPFRARLNVIVTYVASNTLNGPCHIKVYVNEQETPMSISIAPNSTGLILNEFAEIYAAQGARVSLFISTDEATSGSITLTGVSIGYRMALEGE